MSTVRKNRRRIKRVARPVRTPSDDARGGATAEDAATPTDGPSLPAAGTTRRTNGKAIPVPGPSGEPRGGATAEEPATPVMRPPLPAVGENGTAEERHASAETLDRSALPAVPVPEPSADGLANTEPAAPTVPGLGRPVVLAQSVKDAADRSDSTPTADAAAKPMLRAPLAAVGEHESNNAEVRTADETQSTVDPALFDRLRTLAEVFDDAQRSRIAVENRLRSSTIPAEVAEPILVATADVEKKARRAMVRAFRAAAPEVYRWTKATPGLGEPSMARLLGAIGHPVVAWPAHWEGEGEARTLVHDPPFPRTVSQLWSYAGVGDPERKRRKGMTAEEAFGLGNPRAKRSLWNVAQGCKKVDGGEAARRRAATEHVPEPRTGASPSVAGTVHSGCENRSTSDGARDDDRSAEVTTKPIRRSPSDPTGPDAAVGRAKPERTSPRRVRSPYRDVYDAARLRYDLTRPDWTDGHRDAAAVRLVMKEILRDVWLVAGGRPTAQPAIPVAPASAGPATET